MQKIQQDGGKQQNVFRFSSPWFTMQRFPRCRNIPVPPVLGFTLNVLDVELVDLAGEVVLLDGLGAGNRERKTTFEVLHLVHGATEQALMRERERERSLNVKK